MRKKLENQLAKDFRFMQKQRSQRSLYGQYGCEFEDGWYEIIHGLCLDIANAYDKAGLNVDIVIDQVKEKFGSLRFYWHTPGNDPVIHAFDFAGMGSLRVTSQEPDIAQKISEIVSKWEEKSKKVCIRCGSIGSVRRDIGYILPLCDTHYAEAKECTPK